MIGVKLSDALQLPWVEKYRPARTDDLVCSSSVGTALRSMSERGVHQNVLFYGPPGTGKTSAITALARELYGSNFNLMVARFNASIDRGVDTVRGVVRGFASPNVLLPTASGASGGHKVKLAILDEADAMTSDAQAALRHVMERSVGTRFCLLCNCIQMVSPSLVSQCVTVRFPPLGREQIVERIAYVSNEEGVDVSDGGVDAIVRRARGDMRKVLNMLQSLSTVYDGTIGEEHVCRLFGFPKRETIEGLASTLLTETVETCCKLLGELVDDGEVLLSEVVLELHDVVADCAVSGESDVEELRELPIEELASILSSMRSVELGLLAGSEKVQIGGLVASFKLGVS